MIYLDVLILENMVVNLFLLYITAQTLRLTAKLKNMVLAAFIGSLYVVTLIYPSLYVFSYFPFKIIVALIMLLIVYKKKKIVFLIKALVVFLLYSMVLAGSCMFIQYNNSENYILNGAIINFSYKKLIISIMIIYILIHRTIIYIKDRKNLNCLIYSVDIILKDSKKTVEAFLDTGNELREPATNLPVIIVEKTVFLDVDLIGYDKFYIPYKVINGKTNKLQGFKPECIKIHKKEDDDERQVIVAFCENKLSRLNEYDALLPRGVI